MVQITLFSALLLHSTTARNLRSSAGLLCPFDMKTCSDGSMVQRDVTNNCEFSACPDGGLLCPFDIKTCSDGSTVERDAINNCEFRACPKPLLGTVHSVACPNGDAVRCNKGTRGCFDHSPTVCAGKMTAATNDPSSASSIGACHCEEPNHIGVMVASAECFFANAGTCMVMLVEKCAVPRSDVFGGFAPSTSFTAGITCDGTALSSTHSDMSADTITDTVTGGNSKMSLGHTDSKSLLGAVHSVACPNGDAVRCNKGTRGCFDHSPTVCAGKMRDVSRVGKSLGSEESALDGFY